MIPNFYGRKIPYPPKSLKPKDMSNRAVDKLDIEIIKHEGKNNIFTVNNKTFLLSDYHMYKKEGYLTKYESDEFEWKIKKHIPIGELMHDPLGKNTVNYLDSRAHRPRRE